MNESTEVKTSVVTKIGLKVYFSYEVPSPCCVSSRVIIPKLSL